MTAPRDWTMNDRRRVDAHFDATSRYWKELYEEATLFGVIHQERRRVALEWIDELHLAVGSRLLDVGCGTGLFATDLGRRGYLVDGIDASQAMIKEADQVLSASGVADRVNLRVADAHDLPFPAGAYDVVVSLGFLPYAHSPSRALAEMARVVRPGGYVLMSSDNRLRLNHIIDPRYTPLLAPLRRTVKRVLIGLGHGPRGLPSRRFSYRALRQMLSEAGLRVIKYWTLGFGPFSLFGWQPLPDRVGIQLHHRLQRLADRGVPLLASTGTQQLLLTQRDSAHGESG
jgi:ubiquinone/menaquinone biosynthesis C-methylase UbiE